MKQTNFLLRLHNTEELLRSLVVNEMIEALVPPTFLACFFLAYYGPNAELFGNVKSSHFHYTPISDVPNFVGGISYFFMVDMIT